MHHVLFDSSSFGDTKNLRVNVVQEVRGEEGGIKEQMNGESYDRNK
jgi:hypothetical protein